MFSARQIRLSKSRRKSSNMITWWSQTISRSRHASKQLNQCHNHWQRKDWFVHVCLIDWIVALVSARIVLHFETLSSYLRASCVEARFGIDSSSRTLIFGMDRWKKLKVDLAVKLACILKFCAISWCWMSLWRFLRSGKSNSLTMLHTLLTLSHCTIYSVWPNLTLFFLSLFTFAVLLFFHKSSTMASKPITITQLLAILQQQVFQVSILSTS